MSRTNTDFNTPQYKPPVLIRGAHWETFYPHFFRKVIKKESESILLETPDNDFLEADLYKSKSKGLVILSHGLEGSSQRDYMLGMSNIFIEEGYDVLAWNYRGCGSKMNDQPRLYHSGATEDLAVIVDYGISLQYENIILIGFSLGGNVTLKYCGEQSGKISTKIKAAVAISTPLDLSAGCDQLSKRENFLYTYRFLKNLKRKAVQKHYQFPELIDIEGIDKIKDLRSFDDRYTAPIHGFKDANDYYSKCSSINYVADIVIPTLILNAKNDPFLPEECYPYEKIAENSNIVFETPEHGGHVGFTWFGKNGSNWSEVRALNFALDILNTK